MIWGAQWPRGHWPRGHNGREGKGPGTSPSGWADAGSNPGVSKEG